MKTTHQFFIGSLIIGCLLFGVNFVQAADTETGIFKYPSLVAPIPAFPVFDATQYAQDTAKEVNEFSWSSITSALKKAATRTYSSLLRRYLNQIAQETAVYVANGTKGQKPSFYNWKWSEWSEDLLENAAGTYLENFFTAVQEGSSYGTTRELTVTCEYIKIENGVDVTKTANIRVAKKLTTIDNSGWFGTTTSNNIGGDWMFEFDGSAITEDNIPQECRGKVADAKTNLINGGGSQGTHSNKLNLDKYLGAGFDICQPSSMMVAFKIGLGLPGATTPESASNLCNTREMFGTDGSWTKAIQESINNQVGYLKNVQNIFDPRVNDLGIFYSLNSQQGTYVQGKVALEEKQRIEDDGAIRNTNAGGKILELPGNFEVNLNSVKWLQNNALVSQTGDAFIDAANLFISVLSNKLYDKAMARLMDLLAGQKDGSDVSSQLIDFYSSGSFGQAESEALLAPITDMNFGAGSDLDLLNNLASCPNANNPGPMNCVVNNNFVQAISQELTVGEALSKGLLNSNGRFGSTKADNSLNIESGDISWRSMKILRKYRILPVSWEVAAEKIASLDIAEKKITIGDMVGCYNQLDQYETGYNQEWCRGMIDPNWPLRAPLSYCLKSGFGNQIDYIDIFNSDQAATGTTATSLSTVNLLRSNNYCADEQSCLKEGENNSCDVYGYCTEDRRTWKFPSDTCQPYFNTCQAYTNNLGQKIAYLANTLDYGNCNADNSGCAAYCSSYNWASSSFACTPGNETDKYYLSAKAGVCDDSQDGCQQLIRLTNNSSVNLLFNGDLEFSQAGATSSNNKLDGLVVTELAAIVSSSEQVYAGQNALKIISNSAYSGFWSYDWSQPAQSSLPKSFLMRPGVSYTFSAYIYTEQTPVTIGIGNGNPAINSDSWLTKTSDQIGRWQKIAVTINNDEYYNANAIAIYSEEPGNFYIDNMMLEISSQGNQGYRPYRQAAYTYEKILPEYLRSVCYIQDGDSLVERPDAPAECDRYARTCLATEADCQMFTNYSTRDEIPAKINLQNYCPASCVGFASYWQEPTIFNDGREKQLIPRLAETCSAAAVGCTEFTNLDNLATGGENKEYFSYLRQCVKPDEPQANCAEFYNWQNTAETGLQLRSYTWQANPDGSPKLIDQKQACSSTSIQINSPSYNPDCREVRNQAGEVFYIAYSKTITCSANCLSYRLSKPNIIEDITDVTSCQNEPGGHWLSSKAECVVCRGGGQWSENNQACIYRGLPAESQSCEASQNTCNRYSGTGAADWRLVLSHDFDNDIDSWSGAATSSETIRTSGYSLLTSDNNTEATLNSGDLNNEAKYRLQFFAKSLTASTNLSAINLKNGESVIASFNLPSGGISLKNSDWQFYSLDISEAITLADDENLSYQQKLIFSANGRFFLDEVRLMEINDEYYLLENSLRVPDGCNQDYNGSPASGFMLGCQRYQDNNGNTHYLHGFNDLCQESAVGCEAMLNTNNHTNYYYPFQPINSAEDADITASDEVIYAIYDQNKLCSAADKGCQKLGKEIIYQDQAVYESVYLRVDPDRYRSAATNPIRCSVDSVGCQTMVGDTSGLNFFKDPLDQLCEWRAGADGSSFGWYKRPVKSCSQTASFKFCTSNQDCSAISSTSQCMASQELIACPVNSGVGKTIGLGGDIVRQPIIDNQDQNWVGLCPATQSGCTEYLDPISKVSGNILTSKPSTTTFSQSIPLQAFTSYILQVKAKPAISSDGISWRINSDSFWLMTGDNKLIATSAEQLLLVDQYSENSSNTQANGYYGNALFMTNGATNLIINIPTSSAAKIKDISVRPAIVSYQLNKDLNSSECTDGKTNYDQGCILFNERSYQQDNYSALLYNTNLSANDASGISPRSLEGSNNTNRLIKVKPSRTCGKWLECTTYNSIQADDGSIKKICSTFGLCDSLDAYNNCAHFIDLPTTAVNQTVGVNLTIDQISNMTGYSKVGYTNTGYYNDFYHLASMTENGKNIEQDINGSFEFVNGDLTGDGQQLVYNYTADSWSDYDGLSRLIVSPQQAINIDRSFSTNYLAPDGQNFLRLTTKLQGTDGFYGYVKTSYANLIKVDSETTYSMTGAVRTINNSRAGFKIWEYTCKNPSTSTPCRPQDIAGNINNITNSLVIANTNGKWQDKVLTFTTKSDTKYIQLELDAFTENGVAYFDNIQLKSSLAYRSNGANSQFIAPTCRLYPEGNSLSCDYKSSGNSVIRKKGLMGYCLEYDPANEKNCLLWYPLDKIAADPIEEGVGYNGKRPLYYCMETNVSKGFVYKHAFKSGDSGGCTNLSLGGIIGGVVFGLPGVFIGDFIGDVLTDNNVPRDACSEASDCPTGYYRLIKKSSCSGCTAHAADSDVCRYTCYCIPANLTNNNDYKLQIADNLTADSLSVPRTGNYHDANPKSNSDGWYPFLGTINSYNYGHTTPLDFSAFDGDPLKKEYFCKLSNGIIGEDGQCYGQQTNSHLTLASEFYRDQFAVVVTNNTSTIPSKPPVYCTKFTKVVDDSGNNAYWSDRVKEGSSFIMPCYIPSPTSTGFNSVDCLFNQSSVPFASIGYPANQGGDPNYWDSMMATSSPGNQPLFYQDLASGVHAGKIFSANPNNSAHPRYLFAKSYGGFEWQFDEGKGINGHDYFVDSGRYISTSSTSFLWEPPTNFCSNNTRPAGNGSDSFCLVRPGIENVKINDMPVVSGGLITFNKPVVSVNLTFNSRIDANQRPLRRIQIDWGDGTAAYDRTGNFLDRIDVTAPHQFTHRYSCQAIAGDDCQTHNATITLTDNWGATSSFPLRIKPSQIVN